ncbi:uncharacterized protein CTRU02_215754 [Colletotrichum truncatum]|uniref:Uncharacterized protein n=1 Tax=Colletotrichum truncatum TaxID=5467 RepID=A0ACC3YBS8_COLTU|nr:uncharacterized protein CTRU02_15752 [Colletotrichum truncatum]KAF6780702.1 hypothetical protein CTRU02_15752 [Colletotrichum truncatum]
MEVLDIAESIAQVLVYEQYNGLVNTKVVVGPWTLDNDSYNQLVAELSRYPEIDTDRLKLEHDPDTHVTELKMPNATSFHDVFARNMEETIRFAVAENPRLRHLYSSIQGLGSTPVRLVSGKQQYPDGSLCKKGVDCNARMILEVAFSHPRTRCELADRCKSFITGTHGYTRTAVALDIFYDPANPTDYDAILENLDNCFVAVWVAVPGPDASDSAIVGAECVLHWTPLSDPNAHLRLWMPDLIGQEGDNGMHSLEERPLSSDLDGGTVAAPIAIPFSVISEQLRDAVVFATRQTRQTLKCHANQAQAPPPALPPFSSSTSPPKQA